MSDAPSRALRRIAEPNAGSPALAPPVNLATLFATSDRRLTRLLAQYHKRKSALDAEFAKELEKILDDRATMPMNEAQPLEEQSCAELPAETSTQWATIQGFATSHRWSVSSVRRWVNEACADGAPCVLAQGSKRQQVRIDIKAFEAWLRRRGEDIR